MSVSVRYVRILEASCPHPFVNLAFWIVRKCFFPVNNDLIFEAERKLDYAFPNELRTFYLEIGEGRLQSGEEARFVSHSHNSVIHPTDIPKLLDGTCEWMMPYTEIQPDVLPFFDRDLDLFLCLRPRSGNPNAVYWMWGDRICDSLIEFFQRLMVDPDWFNPPKSRSTEH